MIKQQKQSPANRKKIRTAIIVTVILIVVDLVFTGFLKFGYNVVRCGGVPVAIEPGSSFAGGYRASYTLPGDKYYGVSASKNYVCSEGEAESMGIEIDQYSEKGNERLRDKNTFND